MKTTKLIIDLPETFDSNNIKEIFEAGTVISEGMTNGEVLLTVFPNCKVRRNDNPDNFFMEYSLDGVVATAIAKDWWDSPYKAGGSNNA